MLKIREINDKKSKIFKKFTSLKKSFDDNIKKITVFIEKIYTIGNKILNFQKQ